MPTIFLSHARKDGQVSATRLRAELERAGFQVWRDIEDMQGGQAWKDQLRAALRAVDVVVVLLTPAAVASKNVEWEWENALTLEKLVIPLLMMPCEVPDGLRHLHYHNLSTEQDYVMGIISLFRDLAPFLVDKDSTRPPPEKSQQGKETSDRNISVGGNAERSILITGDGNVAGSGNNVTYQLGKNNTKIDKAQNFRIGDDYRD
ncbi:toll/interleukin-1 receptor domain-containing protein [Nodosilinea sp. LEGE 07088]|uniref:toll/interleukin-1 receptor domain-containing protein n=1 Tax=Nodosilinea sp. LEGE 07088 TaxID=2777968 RepID=UPI0018821B3E|nr:toll/interleukin-1 receptor domain-containing protein [Nodosilinea sp. LEGE 07088]MBE9140319.1 toll/interleukin-1 receptor domain-containing protein [Nodosilinea sp. LEGE 07088]